MARQSSSRRRDELSELEFFNIKLERHDVIYAEGAAVETLLEVDECAVNFSEYLRKYGAPRTDEVRCAPVAPYGGRGELRSRVRSAISPWLDRREPIDVIRDRLEERDNRAVLRVGAVILVFGQVFAACGDTARHELFSVQPFANCVVQRSERLTARHHETVDASHLRRSAPRFVGLAQGNRSGALVQRLVEAVRQRLRDEDILRVEQSPELT